MNYKRYEILRQKEKTTEIILAKDEKELFEMNPQIKWFKEIEPPTEYNISHEQPSFDIVKAQAKNRYKNKTKVSLPYRIGKKYIK